MQRSAGNAAVTLLLAPADGHVTRQPDGVAVQRLLVRLDPSAATIDNPDPVIESVRVEGARPPTGVKNASGQSVQGDHTTAWALIREEVAEAIEGKPLTLAYDSFWKAVVSWSQHPWAEAMIAGYQVPPRPVTNTLRHLTHLTTLVETYLRGRNGQAGAAHLRLHPKAPKASVGTGTAGEAAALNHIRTLKKHAGGVGLTDKTLVRAVFDLFDPPFTGPLKAADVPAFLQGHLAPRIADQVTSAVLALGSTVRNSWTEAETKKFVKELVQVTLTDMDAQGIYGVALYNATYTDNLVQSIELLVDWSRLTLAVAGPV
jgi:hypothetical protein